MITGATSGIGLAIVKESRIRGLHILAIQRNQDAGGALQALIAEDSLSLTLACDLSDVSQVEQLCQQIKEKNISLSWVIQAAGMIDESEKTSEISNDRIRECFQVNTFSPMRISQALEPLVSSEGGEIFIGSVAGIWGNSGFPVYSATKAALHNVALSLSRKWEGTAQKSVVIAPSATNTRMREKTAGDAATSQSADIVAAVVLDIITGALYALNGDVVTVSNGVASKLVLPARN